MFLSLCHYSKVVEDRNALDDDDLQRLVEELQILSKGEGADTTQSRRGTR